MVIQGYNVSVSSQRTSLSVQSAAISATGEQHSAQFAGTSNGGGNTSTVPNQVAGQQHKNQNGQGQNQNGQGQNQNGQGQNVNSQGQNQNGQGQNVNNQGQNQNGQGQNVNNQGSNQNEQGQNVNNQGQNKDEVFKDLLKKAKGERDETIRNLSRSSPASRFSPGGRHKIPSTPQELRARMSQLIYQILSGKSFKAKPPPQIENINDWRGIDIFSFFGGIFGVGSATQPQGVAGVQFQHLQYESETVTYQAQGIVLTADGREISVDINMHMSREFASYMSISADTRLVDPLVINYGGTAASLMGEKFLFDLTMDGNLDSLAVLGEGNGFLAIDWNGDRKINDGSQLFGPSTGCGFNELRKYDTDGNGWIDENDEIFDKLVVWSRDKDGNDTVHTLKELGIGAIFLGDISTEFSFKGENNETLGVMRSTSFFIKECGGAGTLSHIDMAM